MNHEQVFGIKTVFKLHLLTVIYGICGIQIVIKTCTFVKNTRSSHLTTRLLPMTDNTTECASDPFHLDVPQFLLTNPTSPVCQTGCLSN